MKALAGTEPDKKPDYRSQSLTQLQQARAESNEILDKVDTERGERFASGDVYDHVSGILSAARPKIQKYYRTQSRETRRCGYLLTDERPNQLHTKLVRKVPEKRLFCCCKTYSCRASRDSQRHSTTWRASSGFQHHPPKQPFPAILSTATTTMARHLYPLSRSVQHVTAFAGGGGRQRRACARLDHAALDAAAPAAGTGLAVRLFFPTSGCAAAAGNVLEHAGGPGSGSSPQQEYSRRVGFSACTAAVSRTAAAAKVAAAAAVADGPEPAAAVAGKRPVRGPGWFILVAFIGLFVW
ncbi:hypothetical protein DFH11DRAFT_1749213 [Phellopilus nigrolimitatus]|nr:hypothetical protein DFH11DRAFT_1749213 [Phellopilus nigrolimitatus]